MIVSIVVLFFGLFMGDGAGKLFRDSDTGWHIRNGESILAGNPLPRTDPYSFTKAGERWFAWEWGADVIMGAAHQWDGLRGVAVLFSVTVALCVWTWFQLHWAVDGNFFIACLMSAPALTALNLHWLARPHVFSWMLCLAALLILERGGGRFTWRQGAGLVALGAVWANVHASFLFLPGAAIVYAAGHWLRRALWDEPGSPAWFLAAAGCGAAGTLFNPYGTGLHSHVFSYLANTELLSRVAEFQSFNFHAEGAGQITAAIVLVMGGGILAIVNRRPEHALLCLGLAALSLRSARAIPIAALCGLPLANAALTSALSQWRVRKEVREALDGFLAYSSRLRVLESRAGGYVIGAFAVMAAIALMRTPVMAERAGFPPDQFPVAAAEAVAALPAGARLLAPDKFGGYLIYRFNGERKVFFDGRSDFYGVGMMKRYIDLIEARPGWRNQVEQYGFTHALLPNRYSLVDGLEAWGWKRVYRDETATLLARDSRVRN